MAPLARCLIVKANAAPRAPTSLPGQTEHWPLHKKLCRAQRTEQAVAAEEEGGEAVPSFRAWRKWQEEARWLNPLVFKLLGERNCKDHAVMVLVEFHAERSPQFEVVNWKVCVLCSPRWR